jgi:tetratricopeptide (TPR) repeat protein
MSPEQAGGERLCPASDIFSLGALLYAILTDQPPYRGGTPRRLLEDVRNARFVPPSRVNLDVPRPLEAICLKAMRREPGARYQSASHLAADIDRWLADEPVDAWTEPYAARLARWMRRHRAVVWAAGLLLILSAAFFAAMAVQADKARDRSLAEQARTAEESRRANANLDRALLAVDKMLVQLSKKRLAGIPQIEPIRRDMLTDALGVYQQMLQDNPREPKLRLAAGKAAVKVGDIQMLLGNIDAATAAYRRGIASLEKLIADRPEMTEAVPELARAYDQAAVAVMQEDPSRPADDEEVAMRVQSDARRGYANQTGDTGRYTPDVRDEVEKLCKRGLELWELAGGGPEPTDLKCRSGLAIGYYRLAHLLVHTGQRAAGENAFQKTRHHQEAMVRAEPNDPEEQALLGSISLSEGAHYLRTGQWDDAEAAYNRGTAAYERIKPKQLDDIEKHPTELGFGRHAIALMRQLARKWAEAEAGYQAALAIREPLARDHRDVADYQFDWARTQLNRGTLFLASGRASEALPIFDDVTDRLTPILAKSPDNSTAKQMLAYAHRGRAETLTALGQLNEAIVAWDRALDLISTRDRDLFTIRRVVAVVRKDGPAATDALKPLIDKPDASSGLLFEAACAFAQASPALHDRSVELLKRCAAAGHFRDPAPRRQLLDAPELAEVRKRPEVQAIIRESEPIR